ncbi:MAG: flagellar basal body rod protein FlgB [Oscillospiraceae bacterium]|nr:flagellar basal body rod protein FlgB [Oscillospiraceae bacterium]
MSAAADNVNIALLQKSLDLVWYKQQATQNNIANHDTPGYKRKSVEFEDLLKSVLDSKTGSEEELVSEIYKIMPGISEDKSTSAKEDGNNVDLEQENIELAKEQLQYEYLANSLTSQINRLKYVINEGKR